MWKEEEDGAYMMMVYIKGAASASCLPTSLSFETGNDRVAVNGVLMPVSRREEPTFSRRA